MPQQSVPEEKAQPNFQKILETVLYSFNPCAKVDYSSFEMDEASLEELHNGFNGYYSMEECRRAFHINNYDLSETCQWLFNEGEKEKEKNIKMVEAEQPCTILAES